MKKVKIVNGAYGYKPEGSFFTKVITANDPPIEVDDKEAERLVKIGVARIFEDTLPEWLRAEYEDPKLPAETKFEDLKIKELIAICTEMGLDASKCRKKSDYIDLIKAASEPQMPEDGVSDEKANAVMPEANNAEDGVSDGEGAPKLDVEDPVV